jgi:hypothetical protein
VTLEWSASAARTEEGIPSSLADAALTVFDMPMETIALEKRSRRCTCFTTFSMCAEHVHLVGHSWYAVLG